MVRPSNRIFVSAEDLRAEAIADFIAAGVRVAKLKGLLETEADARPTGELARNVFTNETLSNNLAL